MEISRRILTVGALLLAFVPAISEASSNVSGMFDKLDHDFGKVQRGSKQTAQFVLTNTSGSELKVRGVTVSCHCTQASIAQTQIGPGQSTVVTAVMDTSGFLGAKSVTVFVNFDRPRRSQANLRVSAVSEGNIGSASGAATEVDFGVVQEGVKSEKKLHLDYAGSAQFKITSIANASASVKTSLKEVSREAQKVRYELTLSLAEDAPAGSFEDRIRIQSNDPNNAETTLLAKATIEAKVSISPERIQLSELVPGQKISKTLIVKASKPFSVTSIEGNLPFQLQTGLEKKSTQVVMLSFTVPADISTLGDHVTLRTDLDGEKQLTIPIAK